jgi:hypothetical protein
MKNIPNITYLMRCIRCDHEQKVTSAAAHEDDKGEQSFYFGSRYDFCDLCDGHMVVIKQLD